MNQTQKGSLLVEILIALALFAVVSLIIGQSLLTGLFAERASLGRSVARRIAEEEAARVRVLADTSWSSLSSLLNSQQYYVLANGSVATGTEILNIDGVSFTRSFTARSVARDINATSGANMLFNTQISSTSPPGVVQDRGSLAVRVVVEWANKESVAVDTVVARWRNLVCGQSDWSATSTSVRDCGEESAGAAEKTNIKTGQNLQLCNGC